MPTMLARWKAPVAYSMAQVAKDTQEPFSEYFSLWSSFNAIYATIADADGLEVELDTYSDGRVKTRDTNNDEWLGRFVIPRVSSESERGQIKNVFRHFSTELKDDLIQDDNTNFFVYRIPKWRDRPIEQDAWGQRLNGVINVGRTVTVNYPAWSPIDREWYDSYINDGVTERNIGDIHNLLAGQIVNVLYTVRNNLVHGGKRGDDANDQEVVVHALPLLRRIVTHFIDI